MSKTINTLLTVLSWSIAVGAAYYLGYNHGARHAAKAVSEQVKKQLQQPAGRFSPGDNDPRGNS